MSEISDGVCWCLRHPRWALLRLVRFLRTDAYARDLETLYNLAMGLPDRVAARFATELAYLERKGSVDMIPYEATAPRAQATGGVDGGYPYAVHSAAAGGGDMRLYWARDVSEEAAVARYDDLVNNEGILGRGVREKSPHSYASLDFLRQRKTKIACCTYHRQNDADALAQMLENAGFRTSFSDGWMLLPMNGIRHPYFRRGVIRAVNYGED